MNGIRSLNAGAPDMRLTGDQRPTYTQRRRDQMAYGGIAGLDGRKRYGLGSWFQEKIMDPVKDFIPNEIKDNPLLTAALIGGTTKLPIPGVEGWLGDLLGKAEDIPYLGPVAKQLGNVGTGVTNLINKIPGVNLPGGSGTISTNPAWGGIESLGKDIGITGEQGVFNPLDANWQEILKQQAASKLPGMIAGPVEGILGADRGKFAQFQDLAKNIIPSQDDKGWLNTLFGDTTRPVGGGGQDVFNWKIPVAGGLAAGAYTAGQPRDVHPADTTGIKFQTAKQVMEDEGQRIKPQEKYVLPSALAAEGGRIGYDNGGIMMASASDSMDEKNQISLKLFGKPVHKLNQDELIDLNEWMEDNAQKWQGAQGGRIGYRDGEGVMMASAVGDESDEIAMELFGKPVKELTPP